MENRKFIWIVFGKIFFLGIALFGIFYLMSALKSGAIFSDPNSPASILLGLPAQR